MPGWRRSSASAPTRSRRACSTRAVCRTSTSGSSCSTRRGSTPAWRCTARARRRSRYARRRARRRRRSSRCSPAIRATDASMTEVASRRPPTALPSFWLLHTSGWLAYGLAMTLSRVGMLPLRYMVVAKGMLMVMGFVISLGLRYVYRPLIRRGTPLVALLVIAVVASYVASLAWTAADNLLDYPVTVALGVRRPGPHGPIRPFNGAVYNAFTMLAWSVLYIGIRYYAALQAQLEALRYQINPHFLFNSLNAVSTLVTERRNDEAARMLARVSDFLRLTLTAPVRDEVALADEIDYVRQYLEIERVRFGERLRTEIDVAPDVWEAAVPAFVLQPLIENAVRYAVAPRESGGAICV